MYWTCKRCGKHDPGNLDACGFHHFKCEDRRNDVVLTILEMLEKGGPSLSLEDLYGHALNNGWCQVLYGWGKFVESITAMGFTIVGDRVSL